MGEQNPASATSPGLQPCGRCQTPLFPDTNFCPKCGNDLRGVGTGTDTFRGFAPGLVIDDRYRLLERLGEGGMGSVYKVEHVRMGKVMALKVLRSDLAVQPAVLERFRAEARIVSRLSHPNTISVFDFGELEGGILYIAMEYVQGKDLSRVLAQEGRLPELRAAGITIQVLRSLAEAHDAGIIHRDIKPANVMVLPTRGGDDWVKVVDFGIAKLNSARGEGRNHITGVAEFVGTPNYCAPEQARGQRPDSRSDLYAMGAMLYELLTGQPPYDGPTAMAVISKHLADPVPHPRERVPELSPALDAVVVRALAKSADERFQTADEMRKALEAAVGAPSRSFSGEVQVITGGYAVASREDWDAFERSLRRGLRLRSALGLAAVVGVLVVGGALAWHRLSAPRVEAPVSEEREINDDPAHANLIALDAPVQGAIGESHVAGKSDLDTYRLEVTSPGQLWVTLSGVPDLNLVLELFDAEKQARHEADPLTHVTVDDGRVGEGELLAHVPVHAGRYFLRVSERPAFDEPDPNRPPRERAGAHYTLTAHLLPSTGLDESEPNDLPGTAQIVPRGEPIFGHTGAALPPNALEKELVLASLDHYRADATGHAAVVALLVQPPDRALGLWDTHALTTWRAAAKAFLQKKAELEKRARTPEEATREVRRLAAPFLPAPVRASASGVALLRLTPNDGEVGVLVAPLSGAAPTLNDAPYGLALADAGPGGLDAAISLARELVARNRGPAARALLQAVLAELPAAEDAARARAELAALP